MKIMAKYKLCHIYICKSLRIIVMGIHVHVIIFTKLFIFANKTFCIMLQPLQFKKYSNYKKFIIVCNKNVLNRKMLTYVYCVEYSCFTLSLRQSAGSLIWQTTLSKFWFKQFVLLIMLNVFYFQSFFCVELVAT